MPATASVKDPVDQLPKLEAPFDSFNIKLFKSATTPEVDVSQNISKLDSTGAVSSTANPN